MWSLFRKKPPEVKPQEASAYFNAQRRFALCHAWGKSTEGFTVVTPPFFTSSGLDFGSQLLLALKASGSTVPHPERWDDLSRPMLIAADVKTWPKFARGTLSVEFELKDDVIRFIPTRNCGPKEHYNFEMLEDLAFDMIIVPPIEMNALNEAIAKAFSLSQ